MRQFLISFFLTTTSLTAFAQFSDNSYRNNNNALYWQNRRPDAAYWQQDVHYAIDASLDETTNIITATEALEYWNNSPDTLANVYLHLYQNAFVKGSHLHALEEEKHVKARLGKYEAAGHGTDIEDLKVDGIAANTELDNTILKVWLPTPLYPGKKVTLSMGFKTYYDNGSTRRRMAMYDAWGFTHYNGVQWFPKMCVYDRKFGWDTYQHLNKEFYGEFGSFDVKLNFASNYVVEATGVLQNRAEVLPDTLRRKLDVKNFAKKPWDEKPSIITPYKKDERKTWIYHADNVHDFAFTADPTYRLNDTTWNGIECVGIVQEPHASGWQNSAAYVARIIETFSTGIGMYQYPKMVAADANDGMEYPMLTLDGGSNPGYHGLLVHEIGHNWFYGMVGSNETYRAGMDEGFTQYLTAYGLRKIDGENMLGSRPKKGWRKHLWEPTNVLDRNVLNVYTLDALNKTELPLNTHSNDFHDALGHEGGYREVYYKTASMLYNLEYTLGDSLFAAAMQHYFSQWRFAHPYFEDFRSSIIQFTHVDLNWFFDEWIETTKTIDYSIDKIKKINGTDSFAIRFSRIGQMQMPLDFTVKANDGSTHSYTIPNTWFSKATTGTTLPKWYGWSKLHPAYEAHVSIPSGIKSVQTDTTFRLADENWLNNYRSRGLFARAEALKIQLDGGSAGPFDRRHYRLYIRPDLWYNMVDGVKAGVHFEGNYLFSLYKIQGTIWLNTHAGQTNKYLSSVSEGWYSKYLPVNYSISYESPLVRSYPKLQLQLSSRLLDGLNRHSGGLKWLATDKDELKIAAQTMWRQLSYDLDYLLYPNEWSSVRAKPNASINLSWSHTYGYQHGAGNYVFSFRAPFLTNSFNYSYAQLEAVNVNNLGKLQIRTRLFGRYGRGNSIPYESALWLAGANPEELMDNKFLRSQAVVPNDWQGISQYDVNHFQQGGGLNLRGYAGYMVADQRDGQVLIGYKGRSGFSASAEVDVDNYINLHPRKLNWLHADVYGFADAGMMELSQYQLPDYYNTTPTNQLSSLRVDAGAGIALTIKRWGRFDKAQPLTLRFDVPFFLSRPTYSTPDYVKLRYVIGINRSF